MNSNDTKKIKEYNNISVVYKKTMNLNTYKIQITIVTL